MSKTQKQALDDLQVMQVSQGIKSIRRPQSTRQVTMKKTALALAVSGMVAAGGAQAQENTDQEAAAQLDTLQIIEFRGEQMSTPKYSRDLHETPRIVTVLSQDLLEEQNITSMRDAMRNVPGISLQAGEGNPPGGDQLKIRGFNARDDINVNGVRDLGNYFRDPFYVEQVEVVKGPNSSFSGRGSAGGTVNFVSKRPHQEEANRLEMSVGTDNYVRGTVDINQPIDPNSAFRINVMSHSSDVPGRDVVNERRQGIYSAYTWGFQRDTEVTVDWLHTRQNNIEDKGLPMDREGYSGDSNNLNDRGRTSGGQRAGDGYYTGQLPPGVSYSDYFGHADDYQRINADLFGVDIRHYFNETFSIRNNLRYSRVENDSVTSSPRIKIPEDSWGSGDWSAAQVQGDTKPRDQVDQGVFNQTDLIFNFYTGPIVHDLVTGMEVARISYENDRRPDQNGERTSLTNRDKRIAGPRNYYDGTTHRMEVDELAFYALNTMALTPQLDLNLGLRWDQVDATVKSSGYQDDANNIKASRKDEEVSYSLGLVYKPTRDLSLYAAYGTAFEVNPSFNRGSVQLAGGRDNTEGEAQQLVDVDEFENTPAMETTAMELGAKWRVFEGLDVNAAVFRTDRNDAITPAAGPDDPVIKGAEERVQGFEILVAGRVTPEWRVYGGYTYLDSEVLKSPNDPFREGQRLGGTPEHSFNLFTTYDLTPQWTLGGGLQYVDQQISAPNTRDPDGDNAGRRRNVSIDSYTVVDAYATYRINEVAQLRVNAYNLFDEQYISQLAEGGAQGIPGKGRQVIATLRYDF